MYVFNVYNVRMYESMYVFNVHKKRAFLMYVENLEMNNSLKWGSVHQIKRSDNK